MYEFVFVRGRGDYCQLVVTASSREVAFIQLGLAVANPHGWYLSVQRECVAV